MNPYDLLKKQTLTLNEQGYLVNHKDSDVVWRVARRPDLDSRFHEQLVDHNGRNVVWIMANRPDLDPDFMKS